MKDFFSSDTKYNKIRSKNFEIEKNNLTQQKFYRLSWFLNNLRSGIFFKANEAGAAH